LDWFYNIFALVIIHSPPSPTCNLDSRDALRIDVNPSSSRELEIGAVGLGMGTPSIIF
jgi:hypothetical protein